MKKEIQQPKTSNRWIVVLVVLMFLAFISFISAFIIGIFLVGSDMEPIGNVAHIQITGVILAYDGGGLVGSDVASSTEIIKLLEKAEENEEVKAVLLEINSPGGSAVASYEIARAVAEINKSTVAWIREGGASGAYWIATAADHIVANPMSITGSIGVIASYIDFSGTLNRYNASYQRLVSGEYKDVGTPLRKMTDDEETFMLSNLDSIRDVFVTAVAENRGLDLEAVDEIADGRFYLGSQALELGLIDQLGGKKEAVAWIEDKEQIEAELAKYERPKTLADLFAGVFSENSYFVGQGIGKAFLDAQIAGRVDVRT